MNNSLIQKIINAYFEKKKIDVPKKVTPFIYSGENHTLVFIYITNSSNPEYVLKINKDLEHSFWDNEVAALHILNRGPLKEFISPILLKDEQYGLKFFLTKFYNHDDLCIRTLNSKTYDLKMREFFKYLHCQIPEEKTITNSFYQDAIDAAHELFTKLGKTDEVEDISKHSFSYFHHGDLTLQNIIWTTNNLNPIVVDWEYSSKGWPFYDILHYHYSLNNIFDADEIIKRRDVMKKIIKIINQINEKKLNRVQIDFFIFASIYSFLLKFGTSSEMLSKDLNKIANSYYANSQ